MDELSDRSNEGLMAMNPKIEEVIINTVKDTIDGPVKDTIDGPVKETKADKKK
jgi:hypothetical protein